MNRGLPLGLLMAVLTLGWVGTVPQASAATSTCAGVWVVVDYGSEGGTSTKCATSYSTGRAALSSAGFDPHLDGGMILQIGGKPSSPDINKAYWSYWTATLKADGSYSGWSYSNLGATSSHPVKGNAEGWHYQSLSAGKVAPAASPPKGQADPKPTATPTKSTPKPSATPTRKPSTKPTTTASATAKPTASSTPKPSATASSKPPTAPASATATASPEPTTSATASVSAAEVGPQVDAGQAPADNGSPVGAIAVGAAVVAGGAGLGGWWLLKGRKR